MLMTLQKKQKKLEIQMLLYRESLKLLPLRKKQRESQKKKQKPLN